MNIPARYCTGYLGDVGVPEQHALDLGWIDVGARADDEVLRAAGQEHPTAVVDPSEVAGRQPAVAQHARGRLRRAVVAQHHAGAGELELPDLSRRQYGALVALDGDRANPASDGGADRPAVALRIDRIAGFSGKVKVTSPAAVAGFKLPKKVKPTSGDSVTLKIKVKADAPTGPTSFTFTGTDNDGRARSATVTLDVQ